MSVPKLWSAIELSHSSFGIFVLFQLVLSEVLIKNAEYQAANFGILVNLSS